MNLDFLSGIGDAIAAFFESPLVQLGIQAVGVYIVIIWLASAYWAFRDMQARSANPVIPYLAAALVVGFTPAFFLLGILVYRIIRPQERLGEAYERGLAEEALIAEIEQIEHCATCGRKVHEDWIICPTCRTRLKRVCPHCTKLVGLEWSLCAWCGRDFERRDAVASVGSVPVRPLRERAPAPAVVATPSAMAAPAPMAAPVPAAVPVAAPAAVPAAAASVAEPPAAAAVTTVRTTRTTRASRSTAGSPTTGPTAGG